MNTIAFAGAPKNGSDGAKRRFAVIFPQDVCKVTCGGREYRLSGGKFLVVCPQETFFAEGNALMIGLEQALLPLKSAAVFTDGGGLFSAAKSACEVFNENDGKKAAILQALGGLIAAYISYYAGAGKLSPVVQTVKDEIDKNVSNVFFSLEDSIKKLPLNYDYVRKLFKKETGATPHDYLTGKRMNLAREIMLSGIGNRYSNYSVSQIAEACGFSDPLYFSRVYKKYYGQAPSKEAPRRKDK